MPNDEKDTGHTNIQMFNHNKVGDVVVAIAPALVPWALFFMALVTLFIGVYWWSHPTNFIALVFTSVNTVVGFLSIIMWLVVCGVGAWVLNYVLNHVLLPFLHSVVTLFRHTPTVHAFNDRFAVYTDERGGVQVHDHQEAHRLPEAAAPLQLPPGNATTVTPVEPPVPTGRELLLNGDVLQALAQGYIILGPGVDGQLKQMKIKKCFSTLVSGLPSSGKTTTVFWIVGQLTLIGAKLWIIDPHMHFEDEDGNKSLASELSDMAESFVFPPCDGEPEQVVQRVQWMYKQLLIRQRPGYIVKAKDTIIGVMDEFNTVADSIDPKRMIVCHNGRELNFSSTLALLEREGRKYGLHFILIAHKWTQRDIGGDNALRTNATTYMCHKMNDKKQAELLIAGGGKEVLALNAGSYWITGISWNKEPARITTPMISAADLPLLLQMRRRGLVEVVNISNVVDADPTSESTSESTSTIYQPITGGRTVNQGRKLQDGNTDDLHLDPELAVKMLRVLEMDSQGENQATIIKEVWGVPYEGRAGAAAKEQLKQIRVYLASLHLKSMEVNA